MRKSESSQSVEINPKLLIDLFEKSQADTKKLYEKVSSSFDKLVETQQKLEKQVEKDEKQDVELDKLRARGVKSPRYKRVLRSGESIMDIAVRGKLNPLVKIAGRKFESKYEEKFKADFGKEYGNKLPGELIPTIEGASAALRAITAAYIDQRGLDQTTRYLLTRKNVLEGELFRVHKKGSPKLHETIAVMEAINRRLVDLVYQESTAKKKIERVMIEGQSADGEIKDGNIEVTIPGNGFFNCLVEEHGNRRGWKDDLKLGVARLLLKRYDKRG